MSLENRVCGDAQLIEREESVAAGAGVMYEYSDNFFRQCPVLLLLRQHAL